MSRRIKVIISVLVAVVVLTVGSAATVMAEGEATPPPEAGAKCLPARVAQILGISQEDLTNAFEQARQEMREESRIRVCEQVQEEVRERALIRVLDRAVEKGCIDEQEAEEIKHWWEQRPESMDHLLPRANSFMPLGGGQVQQRHAYGWRASAKYRLQ